MREPKEFIIPALGVVVLLSIFLLGTSHYSLAYLIILGLLGLAAVGTYFVPPAVQVELRIAIAGLGLLVLIFMFSSLGFWLALIGFGAIGALQIRHRGILSTQLHTVEWLKSLQSGQEFSGALPVQAEPEEGGGSGAEATQTGGAPTTVQPRGSTGSRVNSGALPVQAEPEEGGGSGAEATQTGGAPTTVQPRGSTGSRVNIGAMGAAIFGIIILLSAAMPWVVFSADFDFFNSNSVSLSGWEFIQVLAQGEDSAIIYAAAGVLALLAVLGIASIALPRVVPVIAGILGVVAMAFLFYTFIEEGGEIRDLGGNVTLGIGFWLATLSFLLMAVLQAIPPGRWWMKVDGPAE